ncbi:MAG: UDP-glucose 4-epimerase GalE [Phycisphaerae bacterium]
MLKVFVTGGAGYVGSHCVRALCEAGHEVLVFDNLKDGGHREAVDRRATLVVGDLSDRSVVALAMKEFGADAVMHFAAYLNVGESVNEPLRYYRNNIANTLNLLESMHSWGVKNIVFSSTCATYGNPDRLPITENTSQCPISPYGRTKLAVEWMLEDAASAWGLGATALRYFNASGASSDGTIGEDRTPEYHLIPLVLQVALGQRDDIAIFGTDYPTPDGTCVRDYIHVEDLASAHVLALEQQLPERLRAFNVGTGVGISVREVIDAARRVTGHAIPAVESPRRAGDPAELFADSSQLQQSLGWRPRFTDIDDIVRSAWVWHQAHPNGYRSRLA